MSSAGDAIISIRPHYADAILKGTKTVELRRRIPSIGDGTRLWIYATRPTAALIGSATLKKIIEKSPDELWTHCGDKTGVDRSTYDAYFEGASVALGLFLSRARRVPPVTIECLREIFDGFHPPQVLARLTEPNKLSLLNEIGGI